MGKLVFLRSNKAPLGHVFAHLRSFMAAVLILGCSACSTPDFDEGSVKFKLENTPQSLSNEQVTLNDGQLDCGSKNELWDAPNGNVARLLQKGRDLKFTDDVRLNDPDIHVPYTQVSGTFPVSVSEVTKLRDENGYKLADVKLGITIANECFSSPLPLMGVRKGKFTPEAPVVFRFQGAGKEWSLDKLMH
jgi:hypothetical protein